MSANKWWVLWVKEQEVTVCDGKEDFDENNLFSEKHHHSIHKQVREVELRNNDTMICSCNHHWQHLMTCEHIACIAGFSHAVMFHVRWWNSFQLHCARDKTLTWHFNKMLMKKMMLCVLRD